MYETVLYRCSAKFGVSSNHIKHTLAEEAKSIGIELDKTELHGVENTLPGRIAGNEHNVNIRPGDGFYLVTEELSVPLRWHLLFILPIITLTLSVLNLRFGFYSEMPYYQAVLTLASIAVFLIWMYISPNRVILLNRASSENFDRHREYSYLEASIVVLGVLFVLLGISALFRMNVLLVYSLTVILLIVKVIYLISIFTGKLLCNRFFAPNLDSKLPAFSLKLGLVQVMAIVGGSSVVIHGMITGPALRSVSMPIYAFASLVVLGVSSMVLGVLFLFVRDLSSPSYHDFLEFEGSDSGCLVKIFSTLILVFISYTLLFIGYRVFELVFLTAGTPILIRISGIPALLAIGYFPAGILYQTVSYFAKLSNILSRSRETNLRIQSEYDIRTVSFSEADSPVYFAAGVSTGLNQYILLSEDVVAGFSTGEMKAVVSHEEAHIENGDTNMALLVVFGSILTFLGRNLFYAQFNFHSRELSADESAAENIGPGPLIDALNRFQESERPVADQFTGLGISSFGGVSETPERMEQYFDLFFGDYTIREAHPSVEDRVERLERLQE